MFLHEKKKKEKIGALGPISYRDLFLRVLFFLFVFSSPVKAEGIHEVIYVTLMGRTEEHDNNRRLEVVMIGVVCLLNNGT